jgi:hypothetical protein
MPRRGAAAAVVACASVLLLWTDAKACTNRATRVDRLAGVVIKSAIASNDAALDTAAPPNLNFEHTTAWYHWGPFRFPKAGRSLPLLQRNFGARQNFRMCCTGVGAHMAEVTYRPIPHGPVLLKGGSRRPRAAL